jgi:glutamine phosphoribosylpyrophosphate amidotransferase
LIKRLRVTALPVATRSLTGGIGVSFPEGEGSRSGGFQHASEILPDAARGTTAGRLVALLREAGAKEVHLRITCPPITHACHFGVDMGHDDDLIAARLDLDALRDEIGCDSLAFLSLEGMMRAVGRQDGYCNGCFTGDYPITITNRRDKNSFDQVLA